ncbi:hypothetical protein BDB00DRAFT_77378 [Zychaea mexicana]|uniref:uncharacterized protein n=1 Tax=Zychaea mexicana TaxID=64656 RepID=UPI0022FE06CA|nr:uncharacterized protein BDB00DRAFT_77378 [Zychaea mexicana]KAI9496880.1 hypothetical protein BDB00DRAFT_77378 [Zychaea mexicana]
MADAEAVKARYLAYNAWVKEYVPQDRLLALKLEEGINLDKICAFLDKPVPADPIHGLILPKSLSRRYPIF